MRYLLGFILCVFLVACAPQHNATVEKLDLAYMQGAAFLCIDAAIQSAKNHENVHIARETNNEKTTLTQTTQYMKPFQGCARYNVINHFKKTGFLASERKHSFIIKVCEDDGQMVAETISPSIPNISGAAFVLNKEGEFVKREEPL